MKENTPEQREREITRVGERLRSEGYEGDKESEKSKTKLKLKLIRERAESRESATKYHHHHIPQRKNSKAS